MDELVAGKVKVKVEYSIARQNVRPIVLEALDYFRTILEEEGYKVEAKISEVFNG